MPKRLTERELRRRRIHRRRRLVIAGFLLVLAIVVAIIVLIINATVGLVQNSAAKKEAEKPVYTRTTTYPTLESGSVNTMLNMNCVVLYDATHDTVLYSKSADDIAYPASLTKMLAAIVACKYCPEGATFSLGSEQNLVEWDASRAYLQEDTIYSLKEVLQGLLLPSGADAAYLLAANVPRIHENNSAMTDEQAVNKYVEYMNTVAAELGCTNSHFVTPDGYHDINHYTTANDMLKIAKVALEFPVIQEVMKTAETETWTNGNLLINENEGYYYPDAIGMKTGYTDEAGFCLAAAAERGGVRLIAILLGSTSEEYRFNNAKSLFDMGFNLAENPPTTAFRDYFDYFAIQSEKK